ncbi:MAG: hypothetical protein ACKO5K_17120, partial [Armatimonadota bacterium]
MRPPRFVGAFLAVVVAIGTWVHPVLHLAERNRYEIDLPDAWRTGAWAVAVGMVPVLAAILARRGVARTALLWGAVPLLAGTFEPLRDALFEFVMPLVGHPSKVVLWTLAPWSVMTIAALVALFRIRRPERILGPVAAAVVVLCAQ